MKDKILPWALSVMLTGCLFSGYLLAQEFAFYALAVCNVIAWLGVFAMPKMGEQTWRKVTSFPFIAWTLTAAQIAGLVYSGHTALAASSLIASMMIYCGAKSNLAKPAD
jgi:hypothetical protein